MLKQVSELQDRILQYAKTHDASTWARQRCEHLLAQEGKGWKTNWYVDEAKQLMPGIKDHDNNRERMAELVPDVEELCRNHGLPTEPLWEVVRGDVAKVGPALETLKELSAIIRAEPNKQPLPENKDDNKPAKKRGPKKKYDEAKDRQLCGHWKAAKNQGANKTQFAREHGIEKKDLDDALNREKDRRNRA